MSSVLRNARCLIAAMLVVLLAALAPSAKAAARDSHGTDFWLAFPGNAGSADLSLLIAAPAAASGTVTGPGMPATPFTVAPGTATVVPIPAAAALTASDAVVPRGIHVTATAEVTVTASNSYTDPSSPATPASVDTFLAQPTDTFGTDFVAVGYVNGSTPYGTQIGVVAPRDGTTVTITPSVATGGHPAGTPYDVSLQRGEAYLLRNTDASADLSGSRIESSKPVAVIGGHQCAEIVPGKAYCDHLAEELPATSTWGRRLVTVELAARAGGDVMRFVGSVDGTTLSYAPPIPGAPSTLGAGDLVEVQGVTGSHAITASAPIQVVQYSTSAQAVDPSGTFGDPFQMLVPHVEQFRQSHVVAAPASGFSEHHLNVVAPTAAASSIKLDGAPVGAAAFSPVGSSGFSSARLPVSGGEHRLTGSRPFGVQVYGFAQGYSYGHVGDTLLGSVAQVSSVAVSPAAASVAPGARHCVTATARNAGGAALSGIGMRFAVSGANSAAGDAVTQDNGGASFCYSGANAGTDTVTATAASGQSGAATVTRAVPQGQDAPPGGGPGTSTPVSLALATRGKVKVDKRRRYKLSLTATRDAGQGRVAATARKRRKRLKAGSAAFTIGSAGRAVVRLRLSRKTFRALRSSRRLKTDVTAKLGSATVKRRITLVAPKRRR